MAMHRFLSLFLSRDPGGSEQGAVAPTLVGVRSSRRAFRRPASHPHKVPPPKPNGKPRKRRDPGHENPVGRVSEIRTEIRTAGSYF